jgi:carboxypeptidase family protein
VDTVISKKEKGHGMKTKQLRNWVVVLLIVLSTAAVCLGQSDTARLQGTVTDPQGNAVSGAAVNVTSVETGRLSTATTSELGYYTVSALPPGNYRVDIAQKGFKKVSRTLELQVAQLGVADFQLQVGDVTETITVEAGSPVIDLQDSSIGEVVEGRQITELPLNGRNFTQLALLVPGVTRGQPGGNATGSSNNAETFRFGQAGGASLAVNGLRPQADNFILDGIDNNEALVNSIVFFPPADAIDEFRVQTSVAPAQFGRAGGALVVTTIKSGTNDYHGSAFWFNRNTNLNAHDFFDSPHTPTPGFNRNQFGGTIGGPVIKNKLFLFGDYEGLRQKIPGGPEYATVPTDNMRGTNTAAGNFSELLNIPCGAGNLTGLNPLQDPTDPTGKKNLCDSGQATFSIPIYDPTTDGSQAKNSNNPNGATPFPGNIIPTNRLNSVGLNYIQAFPEPNCTHAQDANCFSVFHDYKNSRKLIENWNDFDIRGDYLLNATNSLFVRFSRGRADQTETTRLSTLPSGFGSGTNFNHPWGTSVGFTSTINPVLVNEARVGFVRTTFGFLPPSNGVDLCVQLGIVSCNTPLLGGIALIGGYNSQIEYTGDFGTYKIPQTGYNYNDTLTWVKGRHTAKFGVNILRRQLNLFRPLAGKGYFQIAGNGSGGCCSGAPGHVDTGYEVSDLLAGFVDGYSHGTPFGMVGTRSWENGFFAQDDFRVTPRLTLNLGLRYDVLTWPVEVQNRQANFDLVTGALVVAGSNGAPRQLIPNDYHNFGPRLGFAYQLTNDGKTVLRGGYGLFYFIDRGGISNQLSQNPPFGGENSVSYAQGFRITLSGSLACEPTCTPAQLLSPNATGPVPSGSFTGLNLAAPTGVSVVALLPTNLTPMVSQWNLQLQRQIGNNQSVSLAYVGTHGAHLTRNYNANQQLFDAPSGPGLYPQLGSIQVQDNSGKSDYHALQAQYERRFTQGLQVTGAFTWSKTIDDSCGNLDACSPQLYTDFGLERGLSTQDQDYALSVSVLYELPIGRGKRFGGDVSRWVDYAIGGWQLNAIYALQAGTPFSITASGNPSSTRADLVGKISVHPGNIANYVDSAAFAVPAKTAAGIYIAPGTSGRDILRGPGLSNIDFAVFKNFTLTERLKGQFRLQAYNLTNTPHFGNPSDTNLNDGHIGQITGVLTNSWRQLELGLRFTF